MITIFVDELVNGFTVEVHDAQEGYKLKEFHEEKIDALKALHRYFSNEIQQEFERRINHASTM